MSCLASGKAGDVIRWMLGSPRRELPCVRRGFDVSRGILGSPERESLYIPSSAGLV